MTRDQFLEFARALPEAHLLVEASGAILAANPAALPLLGLADEVLEDVNLPALSDDPPDEIARMLAAFSRTSPMLPGTLTLRRSGGDPVEVRCDGAVVRPATTESPALLVLRLRLREKTNDRFVLLRLEQEIEARRHLEEELLRAKRAAEVASRARGRFLATMSHELRSPLNAIGIFADMIESGIAGPTTARQKEHASIIRRTISQLDLMIEEILTYSRLEAEVEEAHLEITDAADLAGEIAHLLGAEARAKGLAFRPRLPDSPVPIETDVRKLRQILVNLVGNAIKFTQSGEITLEMARTEQYVEFRVSDTGPGIDPDKQRRIFDPFIQAGSDCAGSTKGAGLGLAISRHFARLLGGEIALASRKGEGSVFTVRHPIHTSRPRHGGGGEAGLMPPSHPSQTPKSRIGRAEQVQ